jgi:uncharacterized membrane protein YccC
MPHHHSHKSRKKRRLVQLILKIGLLIIAAFLLFFGIGELIQGSRMMGVVIVALAAMLLFAAFAIKVISRHR